MMHHTFGIRSRRKSCVGRQILVRDTVRKVHRDLMERIRKIEYGDQSAVTLNIQKRR